MCASAGEGIPDIHECTHTLLEKVLCGIPYNEKVDVFYFSFVLLEIVLSDTRWVSKDYGKRNCQVRGWRPEIPLLLEQKVPELADLMQDCWKPEFRSRPAFSEICERLEGCRESASLLAPMQDIVWNPLFDTPPPPPRRTPAPEEHAEKTAAEGKLEQ